jgi:outer membrane protein assembly factor BamE (lipoprotein component of BamABCDE complex)
MLITMADMARMALGMTRRQVRSVLGPPLDSINQRQYESRYQSVRREAWIYLDVPSQGQATWSTFERGRVTTVQAGQAPASH